MGLDNPLDRTVSRRTVLKAAAATGLALSAPAILDALAGPTNRLAHMSPRGLPDIQFDIGAFIAPAQTISGVPVRFGPEFTFSVPFSLARRPRKLDQRLSDDLRAILDRREPSSPDAFFR